jgi:hypothetical protein
VSDSRAPVAHFELAERYLSRIETHVGRLREGHDPLGHLFAIERLARAARTEWWDAPRRLTRERLGP